VYFGKSDESKEILEEGESVVGLGKIDYRRLAMSMAGWKVLIGVNPTITVIIW
jgi:hypothetical protein